MKETGMREIRFAWVCRNIYFNKVERVELTDTMLLSGSRPSWITSPNCEIIAKILPTGLKDKNNKEIYEGDIIDLKGINCPTEIIWNEKEACFACKWLSAETRRARKEAGMPHLPGNLTCDDSPWEVIGNIYENPELLKEKP